MAPKWACTAIPTLSFTTSNSAEQVHSARLKSTDCHRYFFAVAIVSWRMMASTSRRGASGPT